MICVYVISIFFVIRHFISELTSDVLFVNKAALKADSLQGTRRGVHVWESQIFDHLYLGSNRQGQDFILMGMCVCQDVLEL